MRVDLSAQGQVNIKVAVIDALKATYPLLWAKDILPNFPAMSSRDALLQHKVTRRSVYDQAWTLAEQLGSFDALFVNEQGFVTEGGRSNVFIKKNGQWLTPPISAGCLPGVMRQVILDNPIYSEIEKNFTPEDVQQAEQIIYTNALRGVIAITN
jgi:para-aminobenzoate synthetase/4-amino-4-deoxychorismate lyase